LRKKERRKKEMSGRRDELIFLRITTINTQLYTSNILDSRFTQQELPACKPLLTPGIVCLNSSITLLIHFQNFVEFYECTLQVIGIFALIAVIFIPIGLASLSASESVSFMS
jgi:hypothetical protein